MNVTVKAWPSDPAEPRVIHEPDGGLWIATEVTWPLCALGDEVAVYVPAELVAGLLGELRQNAIAARPNPPG